MLDSGEDSVVHVSHNVTNYEFFYEPFFVSLDTAPIYDERFVGYGFTRNTQVFKIAYFNFLINFSPETFRHTRCTSQVGSL